MNKNLSDKELYDIGFNHLLKDGMTKEEIESLDELQVSGFGLELSGLGPASRFLEAGEYDDEPDDDEDSEIISIVNKPLILE